MGGKGEQAEARGGNCSRDDGGRAMLSMGTPLDGQ
jgi:hypothetical protein